MTTKGKQKEIKKNDFLFHTEKKMARMYVHTYTHGSAT